MLRRHAHARTTFAGAPAPYAGRSASVRQSAARMLTSALRLIVAPFALVAAAIAGLAFAVLLPICGIATISEGIAGAAWRFARDAFTHLPHPRARQI